MTSNSKIKRTGLSTRKIQKTLALNNKLLMHRELNSLTSMQSIYDHMMGIKKEKKRNNLTVHTDCLRNELIVQRKLHPFAETKVTAEAINNFLESVVKSALKASELLFNSWSPEELTEII